MRHINRRSFTSSSVAAASSVPLFSIGKPGESANNKLNVAVVGAGGMGLYAVAQARKENLVAICDVDDKRAAKAHTENPEAKRFKDFRVMLDNMGDEIDAVAISTPDHTHYAIALAAMQRGKHVFLQKPLAHNIWQCRELKKAAENYGVVTQMGNQGRTFPGMRRIQEWVGSGIIGDVKEVITWTNRPKTKHFAQPTEFPVPTDPVPATLDWDLWQGPVAPRPYSRAIAPVLWRSWWDYGCGALGDIGCHTFEAPYLALQLGLPTKVEVEQDEPLGPGCISMRSLTTYHFPARGNRPAVKMKWYENQLENVPKPQRWDPTKELHEIGGMYMEGSKETLYHGDMRPTSPRITPDERFNEVKPQLKQIPRLPNAVGGPIEEWFHAIKGGPAPNSSFAYAADLTELVLIGALAQRSGKTIHWDAENMCAKNRPELDKWIKEPARNGWDYKA